MIVGDRVRIISGPFVDCSGTVVEVRDEVWVKLADSGIVIRVEQEQIVSDASG